MAFLRALRLVVLLGAMAATGLLAFLLWPGRRHETALDLADPPGRALRLHIASLGDDRPACEALLRQSGIRFRTLPPRLAPADCAIPDGITWSTAGAREIRYTPGAAPLACPLAVALAAWEWNVVQPAAVAFLGSPVVAIDHYGSYACRHIYGRATGSWSQHAHARAIDIAGFRLADGRRITVAKDWTSTAPSARFLHRVRDGACRVFATTLSPDYNAAHRDHLHLDGTDKGWSVCR